MHEPKKALLSLVAEEELHAAFACPCGPIFVDRHLQMPSAELGDRLRRQHHPYFSLLQLLGQRARELEDPSVAAMVLAEGLEVPTHGHELAPRLAHPSRICAGHQRPVTPVAVREAIADVVGQVVVADEKLEA